MIGDRGKLRVNSAELYYEVAGESQPLVLLHDGLLDRRVWDDQFVAFGRLYRTIRYDRRGYGKSSAPDHSPRWRTYITCSATWASTKLTFWACPTVARWH